MTRTIKTKAKFDFSDMAGLIVIIPLIVVFSIAFALIGTFPIMWFWNWLAGFVGLPLFTFWQSFVIIFFVTSLGRTSSSTSN